MDWKESQAYWQLEFEHTKRPAFPEWFGHWLAGFVDGEGSFKITLPKSKPRAIDIALVVRLRDDDLAILESIRNILQVGTLYRESRQSLRDSGKQAGDCAVWQCRSILHIHRYIIPFFNQYSLRTKKARDFEYWSQAVEIAYKSYGPGISMSQERYEQIVALKRLMEATRAYNPS